MARNTRRSYGFENPLTRMAALPILARRDPRTSDRRYDVGTQWINRLTNNVWILTSVAAGSANWEPVSQSAGGNAPITKYVVDADGSGDYTTIQGALDAADAISTILGYVRIQIFIRPGLYTENLVFNTVLGGYSLTIEGDHYFTTEIVGNHTPPLFGGFTVKNLNLTNTTDIFSSTAGGVTTITLKDCLVGINNGYLFDFPNWLGTTNIFECISISINDGIINATTNSFLNIRNSTVGNGTNPLILGGDTTLFNANIQCPITNQGTGTTTISGGSSLSSTLTTTANAIVNINNSFLSTGATPAITHNSAGDLTLNNANITTSNNPAITGTGAGVVNLNSATFTDNSNIAGALTINNSSEISSGGIKVVEGTNAKMGIATLVGGTITVNTTQVTANSRIQLTHQNNAGTPGFVSVTARVAGTSFTITSSNALDTSDIAWMIVEPA